MSDKKDSMSDTPKPIGDRLTLQQERFAQEFARAQIDPTDNRSRGDIAADVGYGNTKSSQRSAAEDLLKKPHVRKRIQEILDDARERAGIDLTSILHRLNKEANDAKNSGGERIRALELLGKTFGAFTDRHIQDKDPELPEEANRAAILAAAEAIRHELKNNN